MSAGLSRLLLLLLLTVPLAGCGLIGGIFKAGFWTAVIVVVVVVALIGSFARGRGGA
jgi:hypothetical protein